MLDPQAARLLEARAEMNLKPFAACTVEEARAALAARMPVSDLPIHSVRDEHVAGPAGDIPVRLYVPSETLPLPAVVYLHGGGWAVGSVETYDAVCRRLAHAAGCIVVSVDYRLAPEHKFPAGLEDAYAAAAWVVQHGADWGVDNGRVAVAGDSAGGALATVVCQMARDRSGPQFVLQLLIYPNTDYEFERPSMIECGRGYTISVDDMHWFWGHYLNDAGDLDNPYVVPMRAESLSGLPPALIISAGYDFLRDEDEAYGRKLADDGVRATMTRYPGMIHGFFGMGGILDEADVALAEVAHALRRAFRFARAAVVA